jgi:hypothetical protein
VSLRGGFGREPVFPFYAEQRKGRAKAREEWRKS